MTKDMSPKEFIQAVYINDLGEVVKSHPYIAFVVMAAGIEFLGKCIKKDLDKWNVEDDIRFSSRKMFDYAISNLKSFEKYESYWKDKEKEKSFYSAFRCGLLHYSKTKPFISLSSKNEMPHMVEHGNRINLRCEDFYNDFKAACEEVIAMEFNQSDKMVAGFLEFPEQEPDQDNYYNASGSLFAPRNDDFCS